MQLFEALLSFTWLAAHTHHTRWPIAGCWSIRSSDAENGYHWASFCLATGFWRRLSLPLQLVAKPCINVNLHTSAAAVAVATLVCTNAIYDLPLFRYCCFFQCFTGTLGSCTKFGHRQEAKLAATKQPVVADRQIGPIYHIALTASSSSSVLLLSFLLPSGLLFAISTTGVCLACLPASFTPSPPSRSSWCLSVLQQQFCCLELLLLFLLQLVPLQTPQLATSHRADNCFVLVAPVSRAQCDHHRHFAHSLTFSSSSSYSFQLSNQSQRLLVAD